MTERKTLMFEIEWEKETTMSGRAAAKEAVEDAKNDIEIAASVIFAKAIIKQVGLTPLIRRWRVSIA
jgi:hypothetical protein